MLDEDLRCEVIRHFSTDQFYRFAKELVFDFKLNIKNFPDLDLISKSNHDLINMHFVDPSHKKFVPLHTMEELVSGNKKLI